ncbi:TPA: thioredoxin family protein [Candidatus Woesearchaeota archaeon]|nr:thioredoxin family protein [Candidatus Woesearchaeota archaeon]
MVVVNKHTYQLALGASAPLFCLPATNGKTYSLDDFKDKKILVIAFTCNHCPYVQAYEERLMELQEDFEDKGVQLICINANDDTEYPEDGFEAMKENALEKDFNFVYLRDATQQTAKAYGAECTPHVLVFDEKRKLVYQGGIDDNWKDAGQVKQPYLRRAIEELLARKAVSTPVSYVIGCSIKWFGR